jgi:hypothetical protein
MALAIIAFPAQSGLLDTARGHRQLFASFTSKHRIAKSGRLTTLPAIQFP